MAHNNNQVKLTPNRVFAARVAFGALDELVAYKPRLCNFPEPSMAFKHRLIEDQDLEGVGLDLAFFVDKKHKLEFEFTINRRSNTVLTTIVVVVTLGPDVTKFYGHAIDNGDGRVHVEIDPPEPPIS